MAGDMTQERPSKHFPDDLRVGVLAGQEEQETLLAAHFMACDTCRDPALALLESTGQNKLGASPGDQRDCMQARNVLFRYFEQGREVDETTLAHVRSCEECQRHFVEPTKASVTLEDDAVGGLD